MTTPDLEPELLFENAANPRSGDPTLRRLLLLSWHFPPGQGAGALRWQKLSLYAADHGFALDVVAAHPAELSRTDPARLEELPSGTRVVGLRRRNLPLDRVEERSYHLYGSVSGPRNGSTSAAPPTENEDGDSRGNERPSPTSVARDDVDWSVSAGCIRRAYFAWRQYRRHGDWARRAAAAETAFSEGRHGAVVSCGPPHMTHEGARLAASRLELPFVMDMRDPWSLQERLPEHVASPLWYRLAGLYESRCVAAAALVVCNTETAARKMREAYPNHAEKVITVLNGFDEEPLPPTPERSRFLVAYAGSIYLDRDPRPLFRAAARVIRDLGLTPDRFGLGFLGNVEDYGGVPLATMAEQEGIAPFVETGGFRPRREAMEYLAGASLLVSLPQDSDLAIPSKVYEYLRFPAWVLAMAGPGSATERVLRDTKAHVVPRDDVEGLARVLRARYEAFSRGERPSPIAESHPELQARLHTDSPATPGPDR